MRDLSWFFSKISQAQSVTSSLVGIGKSKARKPSRLRAFKILFLHWRGYCLLLIPINTFNGQHAFNLAQLFHEAVQMIGAVYKPHNVAFKNAIVTFKA